METKKKTNVNEKTSAKKTKTFNLTIDYIIAKRVTAAGKVEYLVKWEGWPLRDCTWEPESNFASPQVAVIFEAGLRQQMGSSYVQTLSAKKKRQSYKDMSSKPIPRRKNVAANETMAIKFIDRLRTKNQKKRCSSRVSGLSTSAQNFFDIDYKKVNESRDKPVGASKRKSSRLPSHSTPAESPDHNCPNSNSLRQLRYKQREESRIKTSTDRSKSESSVSLESNTSLEENKNPLQSNVQSGAQELPNKTSDRLKVRTIKKGEIKVNNDSNKMISKTCLTSIRRVVNIEDKPEETPSKKFLNKVRQRFSHNLDLYDQFLSSVIEYHHRNMKLNNMLADKPELVQSFFSILYINRHHVLESDGAHSPVQSMTDEDIDFRIKLWLDELSANLSAQQQDMFWHFIENKDKEEVIKASPEFFWIKINDIFKGCDDLREELAAFMPHFYTSIPYKYLNKTLQ